MPKISPEDVKVREKLVHDKFKSEPGLSAAKALEWLKKTHKFGMRLNRIYELRRLAKGGGEYSSGATAPAPSVSGKVKEPSDALRQTLAKLDADPVKAAGMALQNLGYSKVSISAQPPPATFTA